VTSNEEVDSLAARLLSKLTSNRTESIYDSSVGKDGDGGSRGGKESCVESVLQRSRWFCVSVRALEYVPLVCISPEKVLRTLVGESDIGDPFREGRGGSSCSQGRQKVWRWSRDRRDSPLKTTVIQGSPSAPLAE
jgi:hypothetical protein